jgi:flagellar motor protein MotB
MIGLVFLNIGCRSLSHKPQSAFQPVPTQPVPAQTQEKPALSDPTQPVSALPISQQLASNQPIPDIPFQLIPFQPNLTQQIASKSTPIPTISYRPPTFLELENQSTSSSEKTMVFRPITPSAISEKPIPESKSISMMAIPTVNNSATTSADVDALNRRITELEKTLAENEKKAGQEKQPTTVSKPIVPPIPTSRWIPAINHPGVTVSSDGERTRMEITDQVLFQSGSWRLNPNAEELLRKIAGEIRANDPESSLEIEGHTDGVMSTDPANATQKHDISSVKTMVIMEYFVGSLRWNATRIKTSNFGSSRPVADNTTPEGRARNNRIEMVILLKKQ